MEDMISSAGGTAGTPTRVVAWMEGTPLHIAGFRTLLASFAPEIQVAALATVPDDVVALAEHWRPHIVVLHVDRAPGPLRDLLRRLHERARPARTVVVAQSFEPDGLSRLTALGVSGVFCAASVSPERLRAALRVIRDGDLVIDAAVDAATGPRPALTPRQTRILSLVVHGMGDDAIAQRLAVSTSTVKRDLRRIYEALDTPNRAGAAALAVHAGLLP